MARRPRFRTRAAANLLSQVEYAKPDVLRRMAMNAERLARSIDVDQLVSESWLLESVTGVRSRGADTTQSLVGSAVIDDLAALAIRLTESAPVAAESAEGGAFPLEEVARKFGVGVRSIQRWRRLGLISVRIQFGRSRKVGCTGAAIAWFQSNHADVLAKTRRPAPTQHARQRLLSQAERIASGGGTLNAAATRLAAAEKISVDVARRAIEQLERKGGIAPLKRRVILPDAKAGLAWRGWIRGVELSAIAQRAGQSRAATLRSIAKQRRRRIEERVAQVAPLSTFDRADAAETLLAPRSVREQLAHGEWPTRPQEFLVAFPPVLQRPRNIAAVDDAQLAALRFLLWQSLRCVRNLDAASEWVNLDRCETALRWAARLRMSLIQRSIREALGRLQSMAWVALDSLHPARRCQAIEVAIDSACAVLDEVMHVPPGERAIRLGSLVASHAEQQAVSRWKPLDPALPGERILLPDVLQLRCVPWLRLAPLRDDLSRLATANNAGCEVLSLRFGWEGRVPHSMEEVASLLSIHPRRVAIIAAKAMRELNRKLFIAC